MTTAPEPKTSEDDRVSGDPGVGGILADPLEPSKEHDNPDPEAAPPSPDPAPPEHHGEWMPTENNSDQ
jgi:hypothetical protein